MTGSSDEATQGRPRRRLVALIGIALAGAFAGLAAIYGIDALARNPGDDACRAAADKVQRMAPLARGEVAAVSVASTPQPVPNLSFKDREGRERSLADWRGRTVLLNLWATWCVPCRREMPALDALEGKLGSPDFEVVAVNIDTRNLEKPKTWLQDVGVKQLAYYSDPSAKTFQDLKAVGKALGMPTTLLIDGNGCELGVLAGPAEWASPDALKLVEAALGR
jgi:thiol-disulfide isomerase/thioredoxin